MTLPRTPSFRLDGRRALVTGASSGIGSRVAAVALCGSRGRRSSSPPALLQSSTWLWAMMARRGPAGGGRCRSTSPTWRPTAEAVARRPPLRRAREQRRPRPFHPRPADTTPEDFDAGAASTSAAPTSSPRPSRRPDRRGQPGSMINISARWAMSAASTRRLLRDQARGGRLQQGDGDRVGPARHPGKYHLSYIHSHAVD